MTQCFMNGIAPQLIDESWTPSSSAQMVLAFLAAEWEKWPLLHMLGDRRLITPLDANLADALQNNLRTSLLWQVRGGLLQHVPTDTAWFEVSHLTGAHLGQLRVIHHIDWSQHTQTNELEEVARVRPEALHGVPGEWPAPILWGHDQGGPFTILEGNHRLTALSGAPARRENWRTVALVGLSPRPCGWHRPDGVW